MGFTLEEPVRVTKRLRLLGYAVVVVVVVLGVVTWRATRPNLDPGVEARNAAGVTVLVYTEDYDGAVPSNRFTGRLAVIGDSCLGLADGSLLVFPHGPAVGSRNGQPAVGATPLVPGDDVAIGGGIPIPFEDASATVRRAVPSSCRGRDVVSAVGGISLDRG